jgi:hypothetical protein
MVNVEFKTRIPGGRAAVAPGWGTGHHVFSG